MTDLNLNLLRKFNPIVDSAAMLADGTFLDFDIAKRLHDAGVLVLKAIPIAWMDEKPVYPDSMVYRRNFKDIVRAGVMGSPLLAIENGAVSWPASEDTVDIEIYIDGERVFAKTADAEDAELLRDACLELSTH